VQKEAAASAAAADNASLRGDKMMTRSLSVALPAGLSALVMCGCVFVAKPHPTANPGDPHDRPVYVIKQGPHESPPNVRTTHREDPEKATPPAHAPAHGQKMYKYHYFPDERVYWAQDRRRYYWLSPRGWRVGSKLPKWISLEGDVSVKVKLESDVPYHHHADVEKAHPGNPNGNPNAKGKNNNE
jgi:hypothetical protein